MLVVCSIVQAASTGYPGNGPWSTVYPPRVPKPPPFPDIQFEPQWDPLYMAVLAAYFKSKNLAHFIWWPWNSDGGDTGGIPANDAYSWNQGAPGNPKNPVHILLPNNGVPWTDVRYILHSLLDDQQHDHPARDFVCSIHLSC